MPPDCPLHAELLTEVGAGRVRPAEYVVAAAPTAQVEDAARGALLRAARRDPTVAAFVPRRLSTLVAGATMRSTAQRYATMPPAVTRTPVAEPSALAVLLAPSTSYEITADGVRWDGEGLIVPEAVVFDGGVSSSLADASAVRAPFPVGTVVCLYSPEELDPRLQSWAARFAGDDRLDVRVAARQDGIIVGAAPCEPSANSLAALRPDIILVTNDTAAAHAQQRLSGLDRGVIVRLGAGAEVVSPTSLVGGERVRGDLGADVDAETTISALARWASGPEPREPERVLPTISPGRRHTHPASPAPSPSTRIVAWGPDGTLPRGTRRLQGLESAARLAPDVVFEPSSVDVDLDAEVVYLTGPGTDLLHTVSQVLSSRAGVVLDLYGTDLTRDPLHGLADHLRSRIVTVVPSGHDQKVLRKRHGIDARVLPHLVTGLDPPGPASRLLDVLVVAAASADDDALTTSLASARALGESRTGFVGEPGRAEWVAVQPESSLAAQARLVVVVGGQGWVSDTRLAEFVLDAALAGCRLALPVDGAELVGNGRYEVVPPDGASKETLQAAAIRRDDPAAWLRAVRGSAGARAHLLRLAGHARKAAAWR